MKTIRCKFWKTCGWETAAKQQPLQVTPTEQLHRHMATAHADYLRDVTRWLKDTEHPDGSQV